MLDTKINVLACLVSKLYHFQFYKLLAAILKTIWLSTDPYGDRVTIFILCDHDQQLKAKKWQINTLICIDYLVGSRLETRTWRQKRTL